MSLSLFGGDRRRKGTHYKDTMNRILGVCHAMGVAFEVQHSTYHGEPQAYRVELVRAGEQVTLTPQYELYPLHVNPKVLTRIKGMAPQLALALNVPSVSIAVEGEVVFVRVPREGATDGLSFDDAWGMAPDIPEGSLLCGAMDDGAQAVLDMTANVHAAVIGMTGSGKTTLLRTMALSAMMPSNARVVLCDPARKGFWPICGHPSVLFGGMFADPREIERCLAILAQQVRDGREDGLAYVFIDEVPSLVRERPAIAEHLATIAERGRHIDMHLALGAQHALVSELGASTLRNIPAVLCGKVKDTQAAYTATGQAGTGAEQLRGHGDFIAVTAAGVSHLQAAQPGQELLAEWAGRYPPQYGRLPSRQVERKKSPEGVPSPTFIRAQSTADLGAVVVEAPSSPGEIGRPEEQPSRRAVCWVAGEWKTKGEPPSLTAIYKRTKQLYPKLGGYGRDKARRTIELARTLMDGAK